nr:MAG TPA: hypothetical protein [Caudoviricetes sp.]
MLIIATFSFSYFPQISLIYNSLFFKNQHYK